MVKSKHTRYSEKTINEVCSLYQSGEEISEINRTYNLAPTTIYHFLKSRGIPTRLAKGSNGMVKEPEVPGSNFTHGIEERKNAVDLVLTTDKEGWVIGAENRAKRKPYFEILFTGTLKIEASTIEEAIAIARKREIVSRIYSIVEKQ